MKEESTGVERKDINAFEAKIICDESEFVLIKPVFITKVETCPVSASNVENDKILAVEKVATVEIENVLVPSRTDEKLERENCGNVREVVSTFEKFIAKLEKPIVERDCMVKERVSKRLVENETIPIEDMKNVRVSIESE